MATFYGYKGYIGCDGFKIGFDIDSIEEGALLKREQLSDALLNNPLENGQLGFVLKIDKCQFNKEAIEILKNVSKSNDDIGDIDIFSSESGPIISWLGGVLALIGPDSVGSNSYDPMMLDIIKPRELKIPEEFKQYIDTVLQIQEDKK